MNLDPLPDSLASCKLIRLELKWKTAINSSDQAIFNTGHPEIRGGKVIAEQPNDKSTSFITVGWRILRLERVRWFKIDLLLQLPGDADGCASSVDGEKQNSSNHLEKVGFHIYLFRSELLRIILDLKIGKVFLS